MRRTILLLAAAALVLAACGGGGGERATRAGPVSLSRSTGSPTASPTPEIRTYYEVPPYGELVKMYDYDTSEPLGYKVTGKELQGKATVYDITYKSSGFAVPGYLVIPDGSGPFPVVLHAHGAGATPRWYLKDALMLARDGCAGLLITSPETREPYLPISLTYHLRADVGGMVQYVIDLRRGLDLLRTLPEIDTERIGFIGYGDGGWAGAILSGVEARIDAYVLVSTGGWPCARSEAGTSCGFPDLSWIVGPGAPAGAGLERYLGGIMVIDSVPYIEHSNAAAFLFQASKAEGTISIARDRVLFEAAPEPKTLMWYPATFALTCYRYCDQDLPAFTFHRAWLQRVL